MLLERHGTENFSFSTENWTENYVNRGESPARLCLLSPITAIKRDKLNNYRRLDGKSSLIARS